jgi:hypothetical protein
MRFFPPDQRSDRTNFPNGMKPIFDGIADALKVNDRGPCRRTSSPNRRVALCRDRRLAPHP